MTTKEKQALSELENLPEDEFQEFYRWLPPRVQLSIKGLVDWREALPEWYIDYKKEEANTN